MSQKKEQAALVEKIGIGIEERLKLSPLAARIYALLILSSYEGLTFEDIRAHIQASKSSASVNINVLTQLGYISFYTKSGDRKRYFKISRYSQMVSLETERQNMDTEMKMIEQINSFNKKYHPEKFTDEKTIGHIYQGYLTKKQRLLETTIQKMKAFRENEK